MKRSLGILFLVLPLSLSLFGCGQEKSSVTEDADQQAIEDYQRQLEEDERAMSGDPPEGV